MTARGLPESHSSKLLIRFGLTLQYDLSSIGISLFASVRAVDTVRACVLDLHDHEHLPFNSPISSSSHCRPTERRAVHQGPRPNGTLHVKDDEAFDFEKTIHLELRKCFLSE